MNSFRYQKKIGSYDKQQWEKTLEEQKRIEKAISFPLRSTKLKTDLIDVDLVRGSTFQKAKPKQTLLTVLYFSVLRYFFLPLFARWWVKETSARVFVLLLTLYLLQMLNWAIYSLHVQHITEDDKNDEPSIPLCELLIPMALSMLLCLVHSQIVATSVTSSRSSKRRSNKLNLSRVGSDKVRRKKKATSLRRDLNISRGYDTDDESSLKNRRQIKTSLKVKIDKISCIETSESPRQRNVNWDSPIKSSVDETSLRNRRISENITGDDGFESLTGKSSSGEDNLRRVILSDTDTDTLRSERSTPVKVCKKKLKESSDTDEENDDLESLSPSSSQQQFETTDGEYIGVTSNSESDCSVDHSGEEDDLVSPTTILNSNDSSEKVSCTLWTKHEAKKAEMSVLDISMAIIQRVESIPETCDYVYIGVVLSLILALTPTYCRLCDVAMESNSTGIPHIIFDLPRVMMEESSAVTLTSFMHLAFGQSSWEKTLLIIATLQRLVLAFLFFFLLAVAERTFKQR